MLRDAVGRLGGEVVERTGVGLGMGKRGWWRIGSGVGVGMLCLLLR